MDSNGLVRAEELSAFSEQAVLLSCQVSDEVLPRQTR